MGDRTIKTYLYIMRAHFSLRTYFKTGIADLKHSLPRCYQERENKKLVAQFRNQVIPHLSKSDRISCQNNRWELTQPNYFICKCCSVTLPKFAFIIFLRSKWIEYSIRMTWVKKIFTFQNEHILWKLSREAPSRKSVLLRLMGTEVLWISLSQGKWSLSWKARTTWGCKMPSLGVRDTLIFFRN
jgi:hypothetical protein